MELSFGNELIFSLTHTTPEWWKGETSFDIIEFWMPGILLWSTYKLNFVRALPSSNSPWVTEVCTGERSMRPETALMVVTWWPRRWHQTMSPGERDPGARDLTEDWADTDKGVSRLGRVTLYCVRGELLVCWHYTNITTPTRLNTTWT